MAHPSEYIDALIRELSRLPGIGPKSASRAAFRILEMTPDEVTHLIRTVEAVKEHVTQCSLCGGISDTSICTICRDTSRDVRTICVVEHKKDILTIEKAGTFNGLYHVLGGVISPLDGIGPDELNIASLKKRCDENPVEEIIMATNPTIEGDATILYISGLLKEQGIRIMRLARGLPVGADIDFADIATIAKSFTDRHEF
ncbi:MAG: recombination mediator RecR [Spirochaetota bacterium]